MRLELRMRPHGACYDYDYVEDVAADVEEHPGQDCHRKGIMNYCGDCDHVQMARPLSVLLSIWCCGPKSGKDERGICIAGDEKHDRRECAQLAEETLGGYRLSRGVVMMKTYETC